MNEARQAVFLENWGRKRQRGRLGVALIGAGVGAAAGFAFAAIMAWAMLADGAGIRLNEDEIAPVLMPLAKALGPIGFLFALSVPAFGVLGAVLSDRVWSRQEGLYQDLLAQGAKPPDQRQPRA